MKKESLDLDEYRQGQSEDRNANGIALLRHPISRGGEPHRSASSHRSPQLARRNRRKSWIAFNVRRDLRA